VLILNLGFFFQHLGQSLKTIAAERLELQGKGFFQRLGGKMFKLLYNQPDLPDLVAFTTFKPPL
jgi:hypothetical protein